jgi:hypothetical protein
LGSALTTGAMLRAHGQGLDEQQHTGANSFGLIATNDERGKKLMCACGGGGIITAMQHSNGKVQRCSINHNIVQTIIFGQPKD